MPFRERDASTVPHARMTRPCGDSQYGELERELVRKISVRELRMRTLAAQKSVVQMKLGQIKDADDAVLAAKQQTAELLVRLSAILEYGSKRDAFNKYKNKEGKRYRRDTIPMKNEGDSVPSPPVLQTSCGFVDKIGMRRTSMTPLTKHKRMSCHALPVEPPQSEATGLLPPSGLRDQKSTLFAFFNNNL